MRKRPLLNLFLMGVGHHEAAWRHPDSDPAQLLDIRHYQRLAVTAERAGFDSVFLADQVTAAPDVRTAFPVCSSRSPCSPRSPASPSGSG